MCIRDRLKTHAMTSGRLFKTVEAFPPRSAPAVEGVSLHFWLKSVAPIPARSSLSSVAVVVSFTAQMFVSDQQMPYAQNDVKLMAALDWYLGQLVGDFELGGLVEQVDVLGAYSPGVTCDAGWQTFDKGAQYRAFTITIPLVVDDLWTEAP